MKSLNAIVEIALVVGALAFFVILGVGLAR